MSPSLRDIRIRFSEKIDPHEVDLFLMRATGKSKEFLWTHPEYTLPAKEKSLFTRLVRRRIKHEPVAYILGHKEFFGLDFTVNKHTLVPRPETELIVEHMLEHKHSHQEEQSSKPSQRKVLIVDVGTGSGNIIISLAKNLSQGGLTHFYKFFGLDISKPALSIARKNANRHGVGQNIRFLHSDLLEKLLENKNSFSGCDQLIIAANLPYLSKDIYESSLPDVKHFEPKSALYSPKKGLEHYQRLFTDMQEIQNKYPSLSIAAFLEISPEQKNLLLSIFKKYFPQGKIHLTKDLANKWRLAQIEL